MLLRAFAKINLSLRIHARRDDGFHEVGTILQTIDWFDEIYMEAADRFEFTATGGPQDESNLVVRAVRSFESISGVPVSLRIHLIKNIPAGAGLGGGSSDAAATFIGLQRFFGKVLPAEDIFQALRGIGSDVPFFTVGGQAVGLGRGDEITPLADNADTASTTAYWLVLVNPGIAISTAEAYSWLTVPGGASSIMGFRAQFISSQGADKAINDFEAPVFARYSELAEIKHELLRLGAFRAALSGSGSTIFGQFRNEADAAEAARTLKERFVLKLTKPLSRSEYFQRMIVD